MNDFSTRVIRAIQLVRTQIIWKPGSDTRHLTKRKSRGHLPAEATMDDYEHVIQTCLNDTEAKVYLYRHDDVPYVTILSVKGQQHWLVMFSIEGLMESAFVVERPEHYLNKPDFELIGSLKEVLS